MKEKMNRILGLILCLLIMSGCTVQMVSTYDPQTIDRLTQLDQQIETMYREMLTVSTQQRYFVDYVDDYVRIEVGLKSLQRYQARRIHNEETIKQVKILTGLWEQDKRKHAQKDTVSDFLIKRHMDQYRRLFDTIINGEMAKKQD